MATTQNTFTGDGSNLGPFSFTFKWLESTDIKVTVAGVLKTAGTHYNLQSLNYSTKTGGQVLFTAGNAPANGAAIVVYRQTDDTDLAATFYSGSAIRAQDLNNNFIQGLYVTQESSNNAAAATATANAATTTANTALSNSTAAQASAASAISTANSAVSTANSAVSTANSAVSTANSASAAAASAVSTANTANSTASSALSAVSEALAYTTVANVAAIPGSPTNGDSLRITNSTGIESFTPLIGVPVGFVGNSELTVEIYYNGTSSTWVWSRYFPNDPENRYWTGSVIVSDTAPSGPTDDSLWYDSIGGRFYIRYNDGNTSQWVDASPQGNRTSTFQAGTAALPGLTPEGDTDTGIYSPGANQVAISTNGTGRVFVTPTGVGVGTTSIQTRLHVKSGAANFTGGLFLEASASDNGTYLWHDGTKTVLGSSYVSSGSYTPLTFQTSDSERARIDTSGRLLVGTSTSSDSTTAVFQGRPGDPNAGGKLILQGNYNGLEGSAYGQIDIKSLAGITARISADGDKVHTTGSAAGRLVFSTTADGASSPTERMRITNAGFTKCLGDQGSPDSATGAWHEFLSNQASVRSAHVKNFNTSYTGQNVIISCNRTTTNNTYQNLTVENGNATGRFIVLDSGNCQNTNNSYTGTSDIKLKQDIVDASSQWNDIKNLQVRKYRFKNKPDEHLQIGLIAQEVESVSPGLVEESPDYDKDGNQLETTTKSVKYSVLYMKAVKALQEAMKRIETLEAKNTEILNRLTALEGGNN